MRHPTSLSFLPPLDSGENLFWIGRLLDVFRFFCFSKELYKAPVVFFMCLAMAGLRQDVLLDGYAEVDEVLSHEASCEQLCNKLQQGPRIAGLLRSVHLQRSIHKRVFLYASTCYPAYTFALPYIITYSYLSYITCVA